MSKVHVANMLSLLGMSMILLNNLVKQVCECGVRVMRPSVDSNTRVSVLAAGEDSLFKSEMELVFTVLQLLPNFSCQVL